MHTTPNVIRIQGVSSRAYGVRTAAANPGDGPSLPLPASVIAWAKKADAKVFAEFCRNLGRDPSDVAAEIGRATSKASAGGLKGSELEELERSMGTFKTTTPRSPYTNKAGALVLPSVTPTEHRLARAARRGGR